MAADRQVEGEEQVGEEGISKEIGNARALPAACLQPRQNGIHYDLKVLDKMQL